MFSHLSEADQKIERLNALKQAGRALEPCPEKYGTMVEKVLKYFDAFYASLPGMPGYTTGTVDGIKKLRIGEAKSLELLLDLLADEMDKVGIHSASGRHMGYIPGGGLFTSALGDFIAAATNRYVGVAYSSPGAVAVENQIIRWLISLVGYGDDAHGNLTSGGSIANLIAVKTARDHHGINSGNVRKSVIYVTAHTHHCLHKAFNITGLHEAIIRFVPMNDRFEMNAEALREEIIRDKQQGLHPFFVAATAGTTDTGAIDPLDCIANICHDHHVWFHVDAAYGGFFMLVDALKEKFKGIERSDSVVLDPHKTLFIPYGSGVVLLRDKENLLTSFSHRASYMKDAYGMDEIDPADTGPELSRHFRGMRIWLPLHIHGIAPFKANLEEKIWLARYFYEGVKAMGLETGPSPALSVVIFRVPEEADNRLTQALVERLHGDGRVFLSSTTVMGKLWIRCAVVHFRTHVEEIDMALQMIREQFQLAISN